jgi:hypothetical protein
VTRRSLFVIVLSVQDRVVLEQRVRAYTAKRYEVVRAKIVLMAADGWRTPWPSPGSASARRRCYAPSREPNGSAQYAATSRPQPSMGKHSFGPRRLSRSSWDFRWRFPA